MRSISTRLTLALLGLLLALGAVILATTLVTSHFYGQQVQQGLNRGLARELVDAQLPLGPDGVRREALDSIFHSLMVINPDIEVYLLDPGGNILEYSAPPGRVVRERVSLEPIEAFLEVGATGEKGERFPILGDDPRSPDGRKIFSVAPVRGGPLPGEEPAGGEAGGSGDGVMGYLYVILAGEQAESLAGTVRGSHIVRLGLWTAGGSLLLALVGGGLLFRRLTGRLRSLDRELAEFSTRQLGPAGGGWEEAEATAGGQRPDHEVDRDEIDRLRRTFRRMAERIEQQIEQLRENDRLRRELVANVSHDLRTPITHLQGYLETLQLKEDVLGPEERREYLEIAALQAGRLGRLVADLFELAKLDARQAPLEPETVSVAELAQDVVQKFRVDAERRGVAIEAELDAGPAPGSIRVRADLDLMERVLDNLIDNALRHTPEGGRVTVAVHPAEGPERDGSGDGVRVEVRDTGPGIEAADLPHIFDRFYRRTRAGSRGASPAGGSSGAGLGLAIAKRALELHGSDLTCESPPGEGATFRFDLRRSAPGPKKA